MTNFEMVEQLRQRAGVTYEEAKAALEASNWDLLEAMVALEKEGKVGAPGSAEYSTRKEDEPERDAKSRVSGVLGTIGRRLCWLVDKGNKNSFVISRKDKALLSLPVTALVLLLLFLLFPTLIVLLIGLFFGFRYAFKGPDLEIDGLNSAMDKAAGMAESIKQDIKSGRDETKENQD